MHGKRQDQRGGETVISVLEPRIEREKIEQVLGALHIGEISGAFGLAVPEFEKSFAAYCGAKHCVAISNGYTQGGYAR